MTRFLTSASGDLLAAQPEGDVLVDRQVREQRVVLEDRVDVALVGRQPGDVLALELDRALGRLLEAADHPQRRGLAAAARAEEAEELAVADLEVDVVDGEEALVGVRARRRTRDAAPSRVATEALGELDEPDCDVSHPGGHLLCRVLRGPPIARERGRRPVAEDRHRRSGCQTTESLGPSGCSGCENGTISSVAVRNPRLVAGYGHP